MAARITFAFLAICLLQLAASAPPVATTANPLDELHKTFNDLLGNLNTQINALVNVKDNEEIKKVYQEHVDAAVGKISEVSNNIKQQYKGIDEQVKQSLDKVSNDIDETVDNLKRKNPELQRKANEVGSTVKQGVEKVIAEVQKMTQIIAKNTEGLDATVTNNVKKIVNNGIAELQAVSTRLHEASKKE